MRNVYVIALNSVPFLPYVYGLLRVSAEVDPVVATAYTFQAPVFLTRRLEEIADSIVEPDVVALSCYVWNFRRHMKLARLIKSRYPEALVIAGGPHVPDVVPVDFFEHHGYVDVLVHGEGEIPFRQILREHLHAAADWSSIGGLTYQRDGLPIGTGPGEKLPREIDLPSPYLAGYLNSAIEECHARGLRFYALWETNRGCPYSCAFCDWGSSTMSKVRRFADDRLQQEVSFFGQQRVPNVFVCDANFGILPRDLELAHALVDARNTYGYPRQFRANFAKNSNDRVFEISRALSDHDMLMGTTLSMQSMSMDVLEAINRRNIGLENFRQLKKRYDEARIHTYTELILGLPKETCNSFKQGIGQLLESGNHDDIRVYELILLPNAPMNDPAVRLEHGIRTLDKYMYLPEAGASDDEIETVELVVETNSMNRSEWMEAMIFAQVVQILHNECFTRYIAVHARRQYGILYEDFYEHVIGYFQRRPWAVFGGILAELNDVYRKYQEDRRIPLATLVASQPSMMQQLQVYGRRRGWAVDDWGWLCIASHHEQFYHELEECLVAMGLRGGDDVSELLRYQSDIMLRVEFDPQRGKSCSYEFDFPAYFSSSEPLHRRSVTIDFRDTHMGVDRQYPLEAGNPERFAKAAIGESYPFVRIRHYQHQLSVADIRVNTSTAVARSAAGAPHAIYG
jgi:putative methyltransferase